ncbi:MAG: amino acid permease [bacterium]|nr:amino acid permease [bacterium]
MFYPPFSFEGSIGLQILNVAVFAPWLFVGFEVVAHSVDEVKFNVRNIFVLAGLAVFSGMLVYIMLNLTGAASTPDNYANWHEYVSDLYSLSGMESWPVFYNAYKAMGNFGIILIGLAAFSALSTSVLGFHRAAARVLMHMAEGRLLPERFAKVNKHGIPVAASLLVLIASIPMPFLGRTAVAWNADVSTLSVAIVYAYISICAYITAKENGSKTGMICGVAGVLMSALVFIFLLVPNIFAVNALAKESYFMLAVWSILGIIYYWIIFSKDKENRFGNSTIMWLMMLFLLFFSANVWVRQQIQDRIESNLGTGESIVSAALTWGNLMQMAIVVTALVIMFNLFSTMLKRVKELDIRVIKEKERSKAKSDFLSNMSHDIRTPMNAIIGFTDLALLDVKDAGKTEDYLHKIKSSSDHLLALINNVLEMSRIESGKIELNYSKMDICAAFEELDTFVGKQAKDKKQNFIIDNSGVTDRFVLCDMLRLRQVLLNLASNAVKYTPEGGEIRISLRETPQEGGNFADYEIKVTDNGIGMSKEFADRIFEAFERENTSTISGIQGTGLGMTITKQIVDLMGGTINLKTERGKGSEFTVNLRLEVCKGHTEDQEVIEQEVDFTGKRLLLVDDIEINREIALLNLEMMGFEVEQAADGTEAVSMVKEHESGYYDAVLMDIQMPAMDGYEATRAIRKLADSGRSNVPIIAMTANAFEEDKKNAADVGMNAHISKPISQEQINAVLRQLFEKL